MLWPQFSIAGWGRFKRWRNGVRFIGACLATQDMVEQITGQLECKD